jgi:hypothetical protein
MLTINISVIPNVSFLNGGSTPSALQHQCNKTDKSSEESE